MDISKKLKERFCKDCNIPIRLFQEPYFMDRLNLFDKFYNTIEKWNIFTEELKNYNTEQDYFEEYNSVKDVAISSIKNTEAYQKFNNEDMNNYSIKHKNLPSSDIFKSTNDGRTFISIDMCKANFSALQHYGNTINQSMFSGASTWEDFIGLFTVNKHIINSKYIRQVILGNCNSKRHITYEKFLMDNILDYITEKFISINNVVFFSNDEIVFDVTECDFNNSFYSNSLQNSLNELLLVPLKVQLFTLYKIHNTDGYYKKIINENGENSIEFKCLDNYILPFVIRKFMGEEITENDKVFYHEGLLAKYIDVPDIQI